MKDVLKAGQVLENFKKLTQPQVFSDPDVAVLLFFS
jgi:hypothetical protein